MLVYRRELISRKQSGCGDQGESFLRRGGEGAVTNSTVRQAGVSARTERDEGVRHRRWLLPAGAIVIGNSGAGDVVLDRG